MGLAVASIQPASLAGCIDHHRAFADNAVIVKAVHGGAGGCDGSSRQTTGQAWPGETQEPFTTARWSHRAGQKATAVTDIPASALVAAVRRRTRKRKSVARPLNLPGSASEDQFHLSVAELLDFILVPPTFYTTFPAGYGKLSKGMGGKLKAKGLKPGMPDILIFERAGTASSRVTGLELKVRGNIASSKQRETHGKLHAVGVRTFLVRNLTEVIAALNAMQIPYRKITLSELSERQNNPPATQLDMTL